MRKYGTEYIEKIEVCRVPVNGVIQKLMNFLSAGEYKKRIKELNYEEVFHLYFVLHYKGASYIMEKNAKVNLKKLKKGSLKNGECIPVRLPVNGKYKINLNGLINRAEEAGMNYRYSANKNNCQRFVLDILEASKLSTPEIKKFVYQDAGKLLPPGKVRKIAQSITDLGSIVETVLGGKKNEKFVEYLSLP
jgi:hypothetical protein